MKATFCPLLGYLKPHFEARNGDDYGNHKAQIFGAHFLAHSSAELSPGHHTDNQG